MTTIKLLQQCDDLPAGTLLWIINDSVPGHDENVFAATSDGSDEMLFNADDAGRVFEFVGESRPPYLDRIGRMTTTCECSTALPSGAIGPCGNPARWRVSGVNVKDHVCCDECRKEWERISEQWVNPIRFDPLPSTDGPSA